MNKPQYHIDEAWVQRYREGKLSEKEQHWLKENPFEAEALEGLAETNGWSEDIPVLQQQLRKRTSQPASLWITYSRYTATIAVLLTLGWFAYRTVSNGSIGDKTVNKETTSQPLAYETPQDTSLAEENAPLALMAPGRVANEGAASTMSNSLPSQPRNEVKPIPVPEQQSIALLEPAAAPSSAESSFSSDEELPEIMEDIVESTEPEPSLAGRMQLQSRAKQARFTPPSEQFAHQISGSVYSAQDHAPLPGVNVQVKGTIVGTVTDVNGQFRMGVPDSSSNKLVFNSVGYQSEEVLIGQQDSLTVQLNEDIQALGEVVVTGRYSRSDRATSTAHPIPTYSSFRNYLQTNLRYPAAARQQEVEGTVKVQFTVKTNGGLADFEIKKSVGYGCDEEAIRLIKEGPSWQPATRNGDFESDQVTVKVRFKLPTK